MSKLIDISGNQNNGTITGALSTKEGMSFDGMDDKISLDSTGSLNITNDAFSCLFRGIIKDKIINNYILTFGWGDKFDFYISSNDKIEFYLRNSNGDTYSVESTNIIQYETLIDIELVYNGTDMRIYVNGILDCTPVAMTGNIRNYTANYWLGAGQNGGVYYLGEVSDVRIYNRALTAQEAKDYHNSFIKHKLIERFEDAGADGIVKTPRGWQE